MTDDHNAAAQRRATIVVMLGIVALAALVVVDARRAASRSTDPSASSIAPTSNPPATRQAVMAPAIVAQVASATVVVEAATLDGVRARTGVLVASSGSSGLVLTSAEITRGAGAYRVVFAPGTRGPSTRDAMLVACDDGPCGVAVLRVEAPALLRALDLGTGRADLGAEPVALLRAAGDPPRVSSITAVVRRRDVHDGRGFSVDVGDLPTAEGCPVVDAHGALLGVTWSQLEDGTWAVTSASRLRALFEGAVAGLELVDLIDVPRGGPRRLRASIDIFDPLQRIESLRLVVSNRASGKSHEVVLGRNGPTRADAELFYSDGDASSVDAHVQVQTRERAMRTAFGPVSVDLTHGAPPTRVLLVASEQVREVAAGFSSDVPFVAIEEYAAVDPQGLTSAYGTVWLHPAGTYGGRAVERALLLGAIWVVRSDARVRGYELHGPGLWDEPVGTALLEDGEVATSAGVVPPLRGDPDADLCAMAQLLLERRGARD